MSTTETTTKKRSYIQMITETTEKSNDLSHVTPTNPKRQKSDNTKDNNHNTNDNSTCVNFQFLF